MPRNVYSEIFLHIVWHTKDGVPMIRDGFRDALYEFIRERCRKTEGIGCYAIGGTSSHLHLAASVAPTLLIAEWIGQLKGASSHHVNNELGHAKALQWQTGYGVVSFGRKGVAPRRGLHRAPGAAPRGRGGLRRTRADHGR